MQTLQAADIAMTEPIYTHTQWRVQPGQAEAFIGAWSSLAKAFLSLPEAPIFGTLLRSQEDPHLFYSFGPWLRLEDVEAMRAHPGVLAAYAQVKGLCIETCPGAYRVVHVESLADETR